MGPRLVGERGLGFSYGGRRGGEVLTTALALTPLCSNRVSQALVPHCWPSSSWACVGPDG